MRRGRLRWTDVSVVLLLSLLCGAYAMAQLHLTEEASRRAKCASNLRWIGQAMLLYSYENRGQFPRTLAEPDAETPIPVWGTPYENGPALGALAPADVDVFHPEKSKAAVKPNDVTAALFLLLRTQDITSDRFVCPSTGATAWDFGGGGHSEINWSNWRGTRGLAAHLSYSYQNPYPSRVAIAKQFRMNNAVSPDWPLAADLNPGVDALLKVGVEEEAWRKGNSPNHGGEGQNVLYADTHVTFHPTALAGLRHAVGGPRDNIYTYGDVLPSGPAQAGKSGDGIVGPSTSGIDSILLPTAKDLGIVDAAGALTPDEIERRAGTPALFKPVDAQMQAKLVEMFEGTYTREVEGQPMTLRITEKQLIGTLGVITITYDYTLTGAADRRHAKLSATGAGTEPTEVTLRHERGRLHVRGTPFFEGEWTRKLASETQAP
ncbi:MAG TPA: hypothetical protein VGR35_18170 [Tepidisphaeraceae bacterium]|nr:hypothetical protein [Tepidisphaeraceae bacterium]